MTPAEVLDVLRSGNAAYSRGDVSTMLLEHLGPHLTAQHRQASASHQTPIATVLTCSDSRVSPELLFGCGIGALFVVRNAGNIVSTEALASLEVRGAACPTQRVPGCVHTTHISRLQFGCLALRTPLLVIMGHEGCAAVTNTVHAIQETGVDSAEIQLRLGGTAAHISPEPIPKYIAEVIGRITPAAVDAIRSGEGCSTHDIVEDAVMRNVRLSRDRVLYRSDEIAQRLKTQSGNGFRILVAKHSISTGEVHFFDE